MTRFLVLYVAAVAMAVQPEKPNFIDVPVLTSRVAGDSLFADIINRCEARMSDSSGPVLDTGSRGTDAHESSHRLTAQIRNDYCAKYSKPSDKWNAFYFFNGKGMVVPEPNIRLETVADFVPPSLRENRLNLYVLGSPAWSTRPLYVAYEWNAYINGCEVAYEDSTNGLKDRSSDRAVSVIEMGIYTVALGMAVKEYDPTYFKNEKQFLAYLRYEWARSKRVFDRDSPAFPNEAQDRLINNLRNSVDAGKMRNFIRLYLDGVWLTDKPKE